MVMALQHRERLDALIEQVSKEIGFEVVETDVFQAGRRRRVRIFIHKEGGITVDDCARFSHRLDELLDVEDFIDQTYDLEVSSPGLDRPLRTDRDFERNLGKWLRVTRGGTKPLQGKLLTVTPDEITLEPAPGMQILRIARSEILVAKVDIKP